MHLTLTTDVTGKSPDNQLELMSLTFNYGADVYYVPLEHVITGGINTFVYEDVHFTHAATGRSSLKLRNKNVTVNLRANLAVGLCELSCSHPNCAGYEISASRVIKE